ncbi:MAG: hypothetical protein K0B10_04810 [Vicingaceae bacterium]|nr:hypothetical protein [Vicingaceae bacterium]
MLFRVIIIFLLICSTCACKYDAIKPNTTALPIENNIIIDGVITYNSHIKKIIDYNCKACHSAYPINQTPYLETYEDVRIEAMYGILKHRVVDEYPSVMPPNKSLSNYEKQLILVWINQDCIE